MFLPGQVDDRPYDYLTYNEVKILLGKITDPDKRYLLLQKLMDAPESGYNTVKTAKMLVNPFQNHRTSDLKRRLKFEDDSWKVRLIQEALRDRGVRL